MRIIRTRIISIILKCGAFLLSGVLFFLHEIFADNPCVGSLGARESFFELFLGFDEFRNGLYEFF